MPGVPERRALPARKFWLMLDYAVIEQRLQHIREHGT